MIIVMKTKIEEQEFWAFFKSYNFENKYELEFLRNSSLLPRGKLLSYESSPAEDRTGKSQVPSDSRVSLMSVTRPSPTHLERVGPAGESSGLPMFQIFDITSKFDETMIFPQYPSLNYHKFTILVWSNGLRMNSCT